MRHAWNWAKIKPDPKNPFFARRSTKNSPQTAVILLRNADIPTLQIRPPVFLPGTKEQVQHSLNTLLFMSDFNTEPTPLAFNVLACSSTGLIHYIQIANQYLSLILPTHIITNGGRNPDLIPTLLKTFLESTAYTKLGYGAYEDAMRIKDQYGITCKNIVDSHWMAKVIGVGSTNVGMLHEVFGEAHDTYIPGRIDSDGHVLQTGQKGQGELIDPRRWDWESHGSVELSRELIRCVAQDAFTILKLYNNIQTAKFRHGYQPLLTDPAKMTIQARNFLLTSIPRGTLLPLRSLHHLLKGPFLSSEINAVDRDALALALVKLMIDNKELVVDRADTTPISFVEPSVLNRRVALPGTRSSETMLANQQSRKAIIDIFGCRMDELRLMQDSDMSRKPEKVQDLECFLGVYEWLEFLPGAEVEEPNGLSRRPQQQEHQQQPLDRRLQPRSMALAECGRKEATLLALFMNFGTVAEIYKARPVETKQWVMTRIERLVRQGTLMRSEQGLIRVNPTLIRQLRRTEQRPDSQNKVLSAK
ncbi:hypothetical protein EDD11_007772 [Mortierella claussenii]|nr:hypothetical protein EDD11_007772 [Mortierella claussenii]